eukprot:GHVP01005029.1.p1 GENE.GHVP01005029.1~~GHVP01005029.1.p1  ORF type:complete len:175 (-),score=26.00 GHVP01005029.1:201-725(-)
MTSLHSVLKFLGISRNCCWFWDPVKPVVIMSCYIIFWYSCHPGILSASATNLIQEAFTDLDSTGKIVMQKVWLWQNIDLASRCLLSVSGILQVLCVFTELPTLKIPCLLTTWSGVLIRMSVNSYGLYLNKSFHRAFVMELLGLLIYAEQFSSYCLEDLEMKTDDEEMLLLDEVP